MKRRKPQQAWALFLALALLAGTPAQAAEAKVPSEADGAVQVLETWTDAPVEDPSSDALADPAAEPLLEDAAPSSEEEALPYYIDDDTDNPETLSQEEMLALQEEGVFEERLSYLREEEATQEEALQSLIPNLAAYGPEGMEYSLPAASEETASFEAGYVSGNRQKVSGLTTVMPSKGKVKGLVFAVEFQDMTFTKDVRKNLKSVFFGKSNPNSRSFPYESLNAYYNRASYGSFSMSGNVIFYRSRRPRSYYNAEKHDNTRLYNEIYAAWKRQITKGKSGAAATKALAREFAKYDSNNDHIIDATYVVYAGEEDTWNSQWWSYRQGAYKCDLGAGYGIRSIVFMNGGKKRASAITRTIIHETGHLLGLPDLYSYNRNTKAEKTHTFDMMNNNMGDQNAFFKMLLGWLPRESVEVVTSSRHGLSLDPHANTPGAARKANQAVKLILPTDEWAKNGIYSQFLMAEYYRRQGNDTLPGKWQAQDGLRLYRIYARLNSNGTRFLATNCTDARLPLLSSMDRDHDAHSFNKNRRIVYGSFSNCFYRAGDELAPWTVPSSGFWQDKTGKALYADSTLGYSGIYVHNIQIPGNGKLAFDVDFLADTAAYTAKTALRRKNQYPVAAEPVTRATKKKTTAQTYPFVTIQFNQEVVISDNAVVRLYDRTGKKQLATLNKNWIRHTPPGIPYCYTRDKVYLWLPPRYTTNQSIRVLFPANAVTSASGTRMLAGVSVLYDPGTARSNRRSLPVQGAAAASGSDGTAGLNYIDYIDKTGSNYSWDAWVREENGALVLKSDSAEDGDPVLQFYPIADGALGEARTLALDEAWTDRYDLGDAEIAQITSISSGDGYLLSIGGLYTAPEMDPELPEGWTEDEDGWIEYEEYDEFEEVTVPDETEAEDSAWYALVTIDKNGQVTGQKLVEVGADAYSAGLVGDGLYVITPHGDDDSAQILRTYHAAGAQTDEREIRAGLLNSVDFRNDTCQVAVKRVGPSDAGYLSVSLDGSTWVLLNSDYTRHTSIGTGEGADGLFYETWTDTEDTDDVPGSAWYALRYVEGEEDADEEDLDAFLLQRFDGSLTFDQMASASPTKEMTLPGYANSLSCAADGTILAYARDGEGYLCDLDGNDLMAQGSAGIHAAWPGIHYTDEFLVACDSNPWSDMDEDYHEEEDATEDGEEEDPGEIYLDYLWMEYEDAGTVTGTAPAIANTSLGTAATETVYEMALTATAQGPVVWSVSAGDGKPAALASVSCGDVAEVSYTGKSDTASLWWDADSGDLFRMETGTTERDDWGYLWLDPDTGALEGYFFEPGTYRFPVRVSDAYDETLSSTATLALEVKDDAATPTVRGIPAQVAYTGDKITFPDATLSYNGTTLTEGTDYTVRYSNNKSIGDATVQFRLKGNYTGTVEAAFAIVPADISDDDFLCPDITLGASTRAQKPVPTLLYRGAALRKGRDYTVTGDDAQAKAGSWTVTLTGKGSYTGTRTMTFTITEGAVPQATAIAAALKGLQIPAQTYSGRAVEPVTRELLETQSFGLTEDADYVVAYRNNTNAGTATALITGIGSYTGILKKTFKIAKYTMSSGDQSLQVTLPDSISYEKGGMKPVPTVELTREDGSSYRLVAGRDYTVSYRNNRALATGTKAPTVIVKGKGSFGGAVQKTFAASAKSLADVNILAEDIVAKDGLTGRKAMKKPVLTDTDGRKLSAGKDYDKTCTYEIQKDGAWMKLEPNATLSRDTVLRVTVRARGSCYTGTASATYRVVGESIARKRFSVNSDKVYSGEAVDLAAEDIKADPGVTFEILSCTGNTRAGTARAILHGTGTYGGTKQISFKIKPRTLDKTPNQIIP